MDSHFETQSWVDSLAHHWFEKGISLGNGVSQFQIEKVEVELGFHFPFSFKELYKYCNGFSENDWNESMIAIWSIERIAEDYFDSQDKNFIAFADYLINSHRYGFLKDRPGIYRDYERHKDETYSKIADEFHNDIDLINANSEFLY